MFTDEDAAKREQLIRDYFDANDTQDWDAIESFMSPDVEFRVGNNPPTLTFEALKTRVIRDLSVSDVTEMVHVVGPCVHDREGTHSVMEIGVRMKRSNGRTYEGTACSIFRFNDVGLIESYRTYLDMGDFWR